MRELALNILDIAMNSVEAEATRIIIAVDELKARNLLRVRIRDNGRGMSEKLVNTVLDPFVTTRTTRPVGMGLSMFRQIAQQCGGELTIKSELDKGTLVLATFQLNSLNRPPMGDIADSIVNLIIGSLDIHFCFAYKSDNCSFCFDSFWLFARMAERDCQIHQLVGPAKDYIRQKLKGIGKNSI